MSAKDELDPNVANKKQENTTNIIVNETTNEISEDTKQEENTTNIIVNETTNEIKDDTEQAENTTNIIAKEELRKKT